MQRPNMNSIRRSDLLRYFLWRGRSVLMAAAMIVPISAAAWSATSPSNLRIEGGRVYAKIEGADLHQTLEALAHTFGARLQAPSYTRATISAELTGLTLEAALRRLLPRGSYVIRYDADGRPLVIDAYQGRAARRRAGETAYSSSAAETRPQEAWQPDSRDQANLHPDDEEDAARAAWEYEATLTAVGEVIRSAGLPEDTPWQIVEYVDDGSGGRRRSVSVEGLERVELPLDDDSQSEF
jgi:hypothetical protein